MQMIDVLKTAMGAKHLVALSYGATRVRGYVRAIHSSDHGGTLVELEGPDPDDDGITYVDLHTIVSIATFPGDIREIDEDYGEVNDPARVPFVFDQSRNDDADDE